jgi:aromatic-L-amino-acid decarboxylase
MMSRERRALRASVRTPLRPVIGVSTPIALMSSTFSRDSFLSAAHRVAEIAADFLARLESRRVDPGTERTELQALLAGSLGDVGVGLEAAIADFETAILPHSMTTPHPMYFGLVNSSPLPAGVLGDLLVSLLNNNGGAYHQSPAISTAEEEVLRVFRQALGIDASAPGMILPGGTFANLQGLLLARAAAFPEWRRRGVDATIAPRLYAAQTAHFSVPRTAQVLGIGEDNAMLLPTVGRGALDVDALREAIARDRAQGAAPFAVVATLGSTGTGALDDVAAIADVCAAERLWLHVDACYGGAAALLEELHSAFAGIERADSVAVDAHKWFFAPIAAALLFTRRRSHEHAAFRLATSYIPYPTENDPFQRGLATSRRASGLTLWLLLRAHGLATIHAAVRRNIAQTRLLEGLLRERGWRVLEGGQLSIACARWEPEGQGRTPQELDALQEGVAADAVASGRAWFGTVRHRDETWLRFNAVNVHTRDEHIHALAELVGEMARRRSAV